MNRKDKTSYTRTLFAKLLLVLLCWRAVICTGAADDWLEHAENLYQDICLSWHPTCETGPVTKTKCCGYCDCDYDCGDRGSCCLSYYGGTLGDQQVATVRFECVKPQFLTLKEETLYISDPEVRKVWMITKCNEETTNYVSERIEYLCANPGSDDSLESLLPVTDVKDMTTYRNRYCAYCNGRHEAAFITWGFKVYCTDEVSFTDGTLLQTIKDSMGNIFYMKPDIEHIQDCKIPSYSISKCNETELWSAYDLSVELACENYLDPFNVTYKNYFCYLCNTDQPLPRESWQCMDPIEDDHYVRAPNYFLLSLDAVHTMINDEFLGCDASVQFPDLKMMKCRDILCHKHRHLHSINCQPKVNFGENECYSILVQLTSMKGDNIFENEFAERYMLLRLKNSLTYFLENAVNIVKEFKIYAKFKKVAGKSAVEYIIVQMIADVFNPNYDFLYLFSEGITKKKEDDPVSNMFDMQLVSYNITSQVDVNHIGIPAIGVLGEFDLRPFDVNNDLLGFVENNTCRLKETSLFSKLDICPFIKVVFSELSMRIENESLIIDEEYVHKIFSSWEYERHGDMIYLCLEDYIFIYDIMPPHAQHSGISTIGIYNPSELLLRVHYLSFMLPLELVLSLYLIS